MEKFKSRKFLVFIGTVIGVATGALPLTALYAALGYIGVQGGVDAVEKWRK